MHKNTSKINGNPFEIPKPQISMATLELYQYHFLKIIPIPSI